MIIIFYYLLSVLQKIASKNKQNSQKDVIFKQQIVKKLLKIAKIRTDF
tara:strand:+ start:287 stop:430 length:144 start_codon:yes stop_codon:yes gene_type:complete